MSEQEAQSLMTADFDTQMKGVNSKLVAKYGQTFAEYNLLVNKQKEIVNKAKLDAERLMKVDEIRGVMDRNMDAQYKLDIDPYSSVTQSAVAQIGAMAAGTIPYMTKAMLGVQYMKSGLPTDAAF